MNSNFTEIDMKANINKQEIRNCEIEKIRIDTKLKEGSLKTLANLVVLYCILVQFLHVGLCSFLNIFFAPCCYRM